MGILSRVKPARGSKKPMKRIGRGDASGHGGTSTRGHKGQLARSSAHVPRAFEGGQMPLQRRSPKWGFTSLYKVTFTPVNLNRLSASFKSGEVVNPESLRQKGVISSARNPIKILGRGELKVALKISAHSFSESAKKAIEASNGTIEVLGRAAES